MSADEERPDPDLPQDPGIPGPKPPAEQPPDDDAPDVEGVPESGEPEVDREGHMAPPRDKPEDD
jgi:hypothetical protein